ncbi:MAG: hypothetical protein AVO35_06655 [Candidatus Aegiribacteria sp. MLS_C]|nr:MAG: hypothetical protein AVO35_06655 [Candidatus Aegiribacteria sp. MLS_C]
MKKTRSGSSKGSSKGFSFSGFKSGSSGTGRSSKKPFFSVGGSKRRPGGKSGLFSKPSHDPGPKLRDSEDGVFEGSPSEEGQQGIQQAINSTGCGCCGSFMGILWLLVLGVVAVVVIMAVKCGGC